MAHGPYKALTFLHLPVTDVRKGPGDTVTHEELLAADQDEKQIEQLVHDGALSKNLNAEVHPDHRPVDLSVMTTRQMAEMAAIVADKMGDEAPAEIKALAATLERGPDDRSVLGTEAGLSREAGVRDGA